MQQNLTALPEGLPVPIDDGLAAHLLGMRFPKITLPATDGTHVDFSACFKNSADKNVVIYIYPLTGQPNTPLPEGWDEIPGARGCTPQACDFSNHYQTLKSLNTTVYGLSSQTTQYQLELKNRLHLPFELLSDEYFLLKKHLKLPTFQVQGSELYKRTTLIVTENKIKKVFYPVFPPNQHAQQVIEFLTTSSS